MNEQIIDITRYLDLYRSMVLSRRIDETEESLAKRGEAFFYVAGSGHEAMAALAQYLSPSDWLHCHYRDKALALARGVNVEEMFYALLCKHESSSGGRRMPGFPTDAKLNILSPPTLVGNNALQAAGVAMAVKHKSGNPIVVCIVGDGGAQQGEFLEAIAESVRSHLPVLFVIEDNRFALSTPTQDKTFYSTPDGEADQFYGLAIDRVDGSDPMAADFAFSDLVTRMRIDRRPRIVVFNCERLSNHTNADDQAVYRSADELEDAAANRDPIKNLERALIEAGLTQQHLTEIHKDVDDQIAVALDKARSGTAPTTLIETRAPLPQKYQDRTEYTGAPTDRDLTLVEAFRKTLHLQLAADSRVSLFGEDIEDPKGDVFGLTRGLSTDYPDRVVNSALSESTIVGTSIGRSLAGERPVAFIQFADFIPVAYNQIMSELGAMYWRSSGQWRCPVIIVAVSGAYRPGLGPYHAQSPESILAHIPGIDVFSPASAADVAGLLNAAFASERPSVFLIPKSLLNDRDLTTSADIEDHFVPVGKADIVQPGNDLTLVTWSSTRPQCQQAAAELEAVGVTTDLIDLRTIAPWDYETVLASASRTGKLLVVHEDNRTAGMGGEICAAIAEAAPDVTMARVTRPDTYVPFDYATQLEVLPSFKGILSRAAEMVDLDLQWEPPLLNQAGIAEIKALGSGPADETVIITEITVSQGDPVEADRVLVSVETDKAVMEIASPYGGIVDKILVAVGDEVAVNTPVMFVKTEEETGAGPLMAENPGRPILSRKYKPKTEAGHGPAVAGKADIDVILSSTYSVLGSRKIENDHIVEGVSGWDSQIIRKRTGIQTRYWIGEDESALTLAVDACNKFFQTENMGIEDIDVLICSTGTPLQMTPSLSCQILKELSPERTELFVQAYDVNAACSGYLYALQCAHDHLRADPDQNILVVTSETLSPVLNKNDPSTYFLFGDAATATLLTTGSRPGNINARVLRPVLSAKGEAPEILGVPFPRTGEFIQMDGPAVFRMAVRRLSDTMAGACEAAGLAVNDLDLIVPHQANERILNAARRQLRLPEDKMFLNLRDFGNTSSNTIPLGLEQTAGRLATGQKIGMVAFGGGFTFGAGIIEIL